MLCTPRYVLLVICIGRGQSVSLYLLYPSGVNVGVTCLLIPTWEPHEIWNRNRETLVCLKLGCYKSVDFVFYGFKERILQSHSYIILTDFIKNHMHRCKFGWFFERHRPKDSKRFHQLRVRTTVTDWSTYGTHFRINSESLKNHWFQGCD